MKSPLLSQSAVLAVVWSRPETEDPKRFGLPEGELGGQKELQARQRRGSAVREREGAGETRSARDQVGGAGVELKPGAPIKISLGWPLLMMPMSERA